MDMEAVYMRNTRLDEMEKYILQNESVSMEQLCQQFKVSMITVRRDIAQLQRKGTIEKIYGGVTARKGEQLTPFDVRRIKGREAKAAIAARAAQFVHDNDTVFLDSGTTTLHVLDNLSALHNVTIVTHSLQAMMAALPYQNLNIISLPGQLYRKTSSFTGLDVIRFLKTYNISVAFMGASAFSIEHGVSNSSPLEYEIKMTAMQRAEKSVLLLDSEKFGRTALLTYAQIADFDAIVTERMPAPEYERACRDAGTELIIAELPTHASDGGEG